MLTADSVAASRPDVDLDLAREVFAEVATLLHNSLALDGLDDHDMQIVIAGLCEALVDADPGAAIRARAQNTEHESQTLHDAHGASVAYLLAAAALQL